MASRPNKPAWWIRLYVLLVLYGCVLLYLGLFMFPYVRVTWATIREQMTDALMMALLPSLLLGLRKTRIAELLLYCVAAANALLGLVELGIPNALGDAFTNVPNHPTFGERALFLMLPAVAEPLSSTTAGGS
jgi:hypothetical protein